jgi:hypothetical protein
VLTALNKVLVRVEAGTPRRAELLAAGIQVVFRTPKMVWVTKDLILRNPPITAIRPTPRLAAWRYYFAETSSEWKGKTGLGVLKYDSRSKKHKAGDVVLKVHEVAQEKLREKYKAVAEDLPARSATFKDGKYKTYEAYRKHTKEELAKIAAIGK